MSILFMLALGLASQDTEIKKLEKQFAELQEQIDKLKKKVEEHASDEDDAWYKHIKVWGFIDVDYRDVESGSPGDSDGSYLPHHTNLGVDAWIDEHWDAGVLLEYNRGTGGVTLQYARGRWRPIPEFGVEAGIIQGLRSAINTQSICNTIHRELVDGPLSSAFAGPPVRDAGVDFFGRIGDFGYKVQFTEGFKGLNDAGQRSINTSSGISGAASSQSVLGTANFQDINNSIAIGARVEYLLWGGLSFGLSVTGGRFDERTDNDYGTWLFDIDFNGAAVADEIEEGFFQDLVRLLYFRFEIDRTGLDRDDFAEAAGVPEDLTGWYVEGGIRWSMQWFRDLWEVFEESMFGFAIRFDTVDLDGFETDRITVGLQIRPSPETVIKIDHEWNREGGDRVDIDDDGWKVSFGVLFSF